MFFSINQTYQIGYINKQTNRKKKQPTNQRKKRKKERKKRANKETKCTRTFTVLCNQTSKQKQNKEKQQFMCNSNKYKQVIHIIGSLFLEIASVIKHSPLYVTCAVQCALSCTRCTDQEEPQDHKRRSLSNKML